MTDAETQTGRVLVVEDDAEIADVLRERCARRATRSGRRGTARRR